MGKDNREPLTRSPSGIRRHVTTNTSNVTNKTSKRLRISASLSDLRKLVGDQQVPTLIVDKSVVDKCAPAKDADPVVYRAKNVFGGTAANWAEYNNLSDDERRLLDRIGPSFLEGDWADLRLELHRAKKEPRAVALSGFAATLDAVAKPLTVSKDSDKVVIGNIDDKKRRLVIDFATGRIDVTDKEGMSLALDHIERREVATQVRLKIVEAVSKTELSFFFGDLTNRPKEKESAKCN
jgi:hypothetical protein